MRNTSIISTFANAIARFTNAGVEMVRALLPVEPSYQSVQLSRLHQCAGYQANLSLGNSRAANQSWLWNLTAKPNGTLSLAPSSGEIFAKLLPTTSDTRDWQASGMTRRQTRLGKS